MKYEILEHKADLKIRVFGKTKEELFKNALFAMTESMRPESRDKEIAKRKLEIKSGDFNTLLIDFLSEVLYQSQVNKESYVDVKFKKFTEDELKAEIIGGKVERLGEEIKAATYHNLDIRQNKDGIWEAIILFDI